MFFYQLLASVKKELLIVLRDRSALLLFFVMPSLLVIIMTILQENVLKSEVDFYLCDKDKGQIAELVKDNLQGATNIKIQPVQCNDKEAFEHLLSKEKSQVGLYIAKDTTAHLITLSQREATIDVDNALGLLPSTTTDASSTEYVHLFFDPIVNDSLRFSVKNLVNKAVIEIQLKNRLETIFSALSSKVSEKMNIPLSQMVDFTELAEIKTTNKTFLETDFISHDGFISKPSPIQQNVSAWTIFGIFFIAVSIAGAIVKERQSGTLYRLQTTPTNAIVFILGKFVAYILICFVQAFFIFLVTTTLLPLLGAGQFVISIQQLPLVFVLLLFIILAAAAYGVFLGVIVKTYEQVSVVGPVSIVIGAAIGGVMVPSYMMPDFMQFMSNLSPLSWGLNGCYDIFLRGGDFAMIFNEILFLGAFVVGAIGLAAVLPKLKN